MNTISELTTNVEITRQSRVGWGWKLWMPDDSEPPVRPDYTGTPRQVLDSINADRTFQSVLSENVWYIAQWFVKLDHHWTPVRLIDSMHDLFIDNPNGEGCLLDSIDAVVKQ